MQTLLLDLSTKTGSITGSTLITYIVNGSIDSWLVTTHLTTELTTAQNIKNKSVRHGVVSALKTLINSVSTFIKNNKTPKNGLVMLAGLVDLESSQYFSIPYDNYLIFEPLKLVNKTLYRCDNKFYIDSILDMYEESDMYGVVYVDGEICDYYTVNSKRYTKLKSKTIMIQNSFKKGGQSALRLARIRENTREHYVTELAEKCIDLYWSKKEDKPGPLVKLLLITGPASFKTELLNHSLIQQYFPDDAYTLTMDHLDTKLINNKIEELSDISKTVDDEINNYINSQPDRLLFGVHEILESIDLIQNVYIYVDFNKDILPKNNKINIKITKTPNIIQYGSIIGLKYY